MYNRTEAVFLVSLLCEINLAKKAKIIIVNHDKQCAATCRQIHISNVTAKMVYQLQLLVTKKIWKNYE